MLVGSGQGFHIAFRFDVQGYHSFSNSVSTLLRMVNTCLAMIPHAPDAM